MTSRDFAPRWASPPSETIAQVLEVRGISETEFAGMIDLPLRDLDKMLSGSDELLLTVAQRLSEHLGASTDFWITRFCQYQDDRERVEAADWVETLPTRELGQLGWIREESDWRDKIDASLEFFGVPDFRTWRSRQDFALSHAKFRKSSGDQLTPALIAWLRMGEIELENRRVGRAWNVDAFRSALPSIRALTRVGDPAAFLPKLTELCGASGVTLLVIRPTSRTFTSGVSRFIKGRPIIQMSARYLSDDHFWFTFFHEAAHVILHSPADTFIDDLDEQSSDLSGEESQADAFASRALIPGGFDVLGAIPTNRRSIINTARTLGISPGVLVGQLQHNGLLTYGQMNGLKRRYRWSGTILEKT